MQTEQHTISPIFGFDMFTRHLAVPAQMTLADDISARGNEVMRRLSNDYYRARKNGLQNVISTTQAGLGRLV